MSEVKEHSVIYLSPSDDPEREWCQDDVWEESVRYNLGADFDRVTAERDAMQARETGTRSLLRMAEDSIKHILEREKALQALLTAAEERADVLEAQLAESRKITLSGCEFSEHDLIRRAVRAASGDSRRGTQRWVAMKDAFGCGSGVANALCHRFGFDPDEMVKP